MKGKVSLLDGGLEAWKKAGFTTRRSAVREKRKIQTSFTRIYRGQDYVLKNLNTNTTVIVDARMKNL